MSLKDKLLATLFIDLRGDTARVVQGRVAGSDLNIIVDGFGTLTLPGFFDPGAGREGLPGYAGILKQFLREQNMRAARVVAGLGQSGVITRSVRVPRVPPRDLAGLMALEINDYLPVSAEEYVFDYKVMDVIEEDNAGYLEVMVAAVNREQVEQYAALLEMAGLDPVVFDILPNILHRLFSFAPYRDIMVLDGGSDGTRITVLKGKSLFMYADVPFYTNPTGDNDFSFLAAEMRGYLDFFSSRNFGKNVDLVAVLGETAVLPGIKAELESLLPVPVTVDLSPAGFTGFKGRRAFDFHKQAPVYAGNLGLMLREGRYGIAGTVPVNPVATGTGETTGAAPGM